MTSLYDCGSGGSGGSIISAGPNSPSNPKVGTLWFDTNTDQLKKWDGTTWQVIAIGGGGGSGISFPPPVDFAVPPAQVYPTGTILVHNGADPAIIEAGYTGEAGNTAHARDWMVFDGTNWHLLRNAGNVQGVSFAAVNLPANAGGVNAAWTALPAPPTDPIVIATFEGSTYLKTGPGNAAGDWTLVDTPLAFADAAEVLAGTVTDHVIAPDTLQSRILYAPTTTPTQDAHYLVGLGSQGRIDARFIPFSPLSYLGAVDVTTAYTAPATAPEIGSFGVVQTDGTADASWGAVNVTGDFDAGDLLIWNGTGFDAVEQQGAFLPLAGGTHTDTAVVTYGVPAGAAPAAPVVRLDGSDLAKSAIDNFTLNGAQIALPALAAITVTAGAVANDEVDITVAGGPADVAYTVTLTYETDAGPGQVKNAAIPQYATADMAANILAAAVTGDIVATKTGPGVLRVSLGTATQLIAMAPTVA